MVDIHTFKAIVKFDFDDNKEIVLENISPFQENKSVVIYNQDLLQQLKGKDFTANQIKYIMKTNIEYCSKFDENLVEINRNCIVDIFI